MRRLIPTALSAFGLALSAGCQHQTYVDRQKVDTQPLVVDEAMQQRVWEPTKAVYQNGSTKNWSTGFAYSPNHDFPPYSYAATDSFTFGLNVLTLPYTAVTQRDGVVSGGVQLPPSYTAVPPMEKSDANKP